MRRGKKNPLLLLVYGGGGDFRRYGDAVEQWREFLRISIWSFSIRSEFTSGVIGFRCRGHCTEDSPAAMGDFLVS